MEAFRVLIEYSLYFFTRLIKYRDQTADFSLHEAKHKLDLLYPSMGSIEGEAIMDIISFLSTIMEAFEGKRLTECLSFRAFVFFLIIYAYKSSTNVLYLSNNNHDRLLVTWQLIIH